MKAKRCSGFFVPRPNGKKRRAAAVVEFAVVLPLLLTILFGIIEYGWVFMVRQTLQTAAREGARVSVLATSSAPWTSAKARASEVVAPLGLSASTTVTETTVAGSQVVTFVVTVPYADVSLTGGYFGPTDFNLSGTCSMRREGF